MATIKAIEGRSVHQIQSGQVIVDLCSVVKELVENSLDAGANILDVRFKGNGLDAIEVQDNGAGISKDDFESLALKHYTSKLSSYDDLSKLDTFGFRGEALSSLCALATLTVTTAKEEEAPKGSRLEFETSGKLKNASVAACPRGTTVTVENLFHKLPVRRKELEKSIKREYNKVITLLNAYACVSTRTKFSVSNQPTKSKKNVVFSTKSNEKTRDNIANVFGAKTISALTPLDLILEMESTRPTPALLELHGAQALRNSRVEIHGHVSRPVHGEGRQTPDRQMFFVNSRPCILPQVAKAFNEIYKSYNVTQSPFIFANLIMDTNAYDVNVSPDKRSIMLHDQQHLLETLKDSLVALFEAQEQTVPMTQPPNTEMTPFKPPSFIKQSSSVQNAHTAPRSQQRDSSSSVSAAGSPTSTTQASPAPAALSQSAPPSATLPGLTRIENDESTNAISNAKARIVQDFNARLFDQQATAAHTQPEGNAASRSPAPDAVAEPRSPLFVRSRTTSPHRDEHEEVAEIKRSASAEDRNRRGLHTHEAVNTAAAASPVEASSRKRKRTMTQTENTTDSRLAKASSFSNRLRSFAAAGSSVSAPLRESHERVSDVEEDEDDSDAPGSYTQAARDVQDDPHWQTLAEGRSSASQSDEDMIDDDNEANEDHGVTNNVSHTEEDGTPDDDDDDDYENDDANEPATLHPGRPDRKLARTIMSSSSSRINNVLKTISVTTVDVSALSHCLQRADPDEQNLPPHQSQAEDQTSSGVSPEDRLSLTIVKSDFSRMRIVGQFNLGFILAVRPSDGPSDDPQEESGMQSRPAQSDDLFIIDQHASDEIYNFHRLSATTELTPQPLVRPQQLELTAIEEETIITHKDHSLFKNGFRIDVDESGESPVGQRCKLMTLPTSKETVFTTADLEELLVLLQDAPAPSTDAASTSTNDPIHSLTASSTSIVRPAKVRRMLAMRACRSSIMVGRALTGKQMGAVLRHMGEMTRPWNCPHGRPTMRHVCGLGTLRTWREGSEAAWAHQEDEFELQDERAWTGGSVDWLDFVNRDG